MTTQITIIGLGQIGTSIGMALAGQEGIRTVGFDINPKVARQVEKLKVMSHVDFNIPNAVSNADIVLLAIPTDQTHEMIEFVVDDMTEDAILMETCLAKQAVVQWVEELNKPNFQYVGLTPIINPRYLEQPGSGPDTAHADLFQNGLIGIIAPNKTSGDALKKAEALANLLGASPFFADPVEIDGLVAATHILPQLLASVLINVTQDQPGWSDGRKIASRTYAVVSSALLQSGSPDSLVSAVINNQENICRMLEYTVKALLAVRDEIRSEDDLALKQNIEKSFYGREKWFGQRISKQWEGEVLPAPEMPASRGAFGRMFGIGRKPKKPDQDKK